MKYAATKIITTGIAITYHGTSAVVVIRFTLHEQSNKVRQMIDKMNESLFIGITPLTIFFSTIIIS